MKRDLSTDESEVEDDTEVKTPKTLSFTDLQPEEDLNFDLPDGSKIPFKLPEQMSGEDHAAMISLENKMNGTFDKMKKNYKNKENVAAYEHQVDIFVLFILPDIPTDFLATLTTGQKMKLIDWWRKNSADPKKE